MLRKRECDGQRREWGGDCEPEVSLTTQSVNFVEQVSLLGKQAESRNVELPCNGAGGV